MILSRVRLAVRRLAIIIIIVVSLAEAGVSPPPSPFDHFARLGKIRAFPSEEKDDDRPESTRTYHDDSAESGDRNHERWWSTAP